MAQQARCPDARFAHLELAGRYSIKAAAAAEASREAANAREAEAVFGGAAYYQRLETGARWLARRAGSSVERDRHLGMANRYHRLRKDAAVWRGGRS
jgi:hypothetical protein